MRIVRFALALATWLGFAGVLAYLVATRYFAESTWQTTVLLYLPHGLVLVPLAGLGLLLALVGPRRLLVVLTGAVVIVLFPIMGLKLRGGSDATGPHLRLLTYNVDSGQRSIPEIVAQIGEAAPDIVLLQESSAQVDDAVAAALPGFTMHHSTQFLLASRYPIAAVELPPKVSAGGKERSPRFVGYTLDTPLGKLDIINVHPISPRDGFEEIRGEGLSREIESGRVFAGDRHALMDNTELRRIQVDAIAAVVRHAAHPVILAGDTNLPGGSAILAEGLSSLDDAFAEAGRGFGYTFPAHKYLPWMRIDRIFVGTGLRATRAEVGTHRGSDHHCLFADIEAVAPHEKP